jgi:hypothetical protein
MVDEFDACCIGGLLRSTLRDGDVSYEVSVDRPTGSKALEARGRCLRLVCGSELIQGLYAGCVATTTSHTGVGTYLKTTTVDQEGLFLGIQFI